MQKNNLDSVYDLKNKRFVSRKPILEELGFVWNEVSGEFSVKGIYSTYWETVVNDTDEEFEKHLKSIKDILLRHNQSVSIDLTSLLTMDKADISELISDKLEAISDGWIDPVDLFIYSKKLEYLTKTLVDAVKDKVDPSLFGKDYVKHGVELSEGMTGVKYDFSKCGDPEWQDLNMLAINADIRLKERQDFLKAITKPTDILVNGEEVVCIIPPTKTGKLSPIAKIK